MVPWEKIASTATPEGAELALWRRDREVVVRIGGAELMSNRRVGSEEHLAEIACENLAAGSRVLIGGLGLGFTLRRTLAVVPPRCEVIVGELVPVLADWLREHLDAGDVLDDPRVTFAFGDVAAKMVRGHSHFDAIMLDVDNGPSAVTANANRSLYSARGLARARNALRDGGRLVVWSAGPDEAFVERLRRAGFRVRVVATRARRDKGPRHVLFVADRIPERA
jgi:spermidine synthase